MPRFDVARGDASSSPPLRLSRAGEAQGRARAPQARGTMWRWVVTAGLAVGYWFWRRKRGDHRIKERGIRSLWGPEEQAPLEPNAASAPAVEAHPHHQSHG